MTNHYIHKPIFFLILALTFWTFGIGQTSNQSQAANKNESTLISAGKPKLIKTQGSGNSDNIHCSLQDKAGNLWFGTTGDGVYRIPHNKTKTLNEQDKGTIHIFTASIKTVK